MKTINNFLMLIGRWCLGLIFVLAGIGKFLNYDQTAAFMASKGLAPIPVLLIIAALVELVGGISLIIGYKTRWGALLLLLYLIPTTLIFHNFWGLQGDARTLMMVDFLKNLAIFGGLLYVLSRGAGSFALDALSKRSDEYHDHG